MYGNENGLFSGTMTGAKASNVVALARSAEATGMCHG